MPLAESRLEVLQVRKLIQCVRLQDSDQIAKLVQLGIPGLINYQGESFFLPVKYVVRLRVFHGTLLCYLAVRTLRSQIISFH